MPRVCRFKLRTSQANGSNSCARSVQILALGIIANVDTKISVLEFNEVQAAARTLNLDIVPLEIRRAEEITPAFDALKGRAQALYVALDPITSANRVRIKHL